MTRIVRIGEPFVAAISLVVASLTSVVASAQGAPPIEPRPKEEVVTPDGINLADLSFQFLTPGVSVGQGDFPAKLAYRRRLNATSASILDSSIMTYLFLGTVPVYQGYYSQDVFFVSYQGKRYIFYLSGMENISKDGSTLSFLPTGGNTSYSISVGAANGIYTFRTKDGTTVKIISGPGSYCNYATWCAQSVQTPSGIFANYEYISVGTTNNPKVVLQKITNNYGYSLNFNYNNEFLTSVLGSATCVAGSALNCNVGTFGQESYVHTDTPHTYTDNGQIITYQMGVIASVLDSNNRATTLGYTNGLLSSVRYPENPNVKAIEVTYPDPNTPYYITSVKNGSGQVTTFESYSGTDSSWNSGYQPLPYPDDYPWYARPAKIIVTDPLLHKSIYQFAGDGVLASYENHLGNRRLYSYETLLPEASPRLTGIFEPSGFEERYTYDARGNVTSKALRGVGQADTWFTAAYPACDATNDRICNQPSYVIDERGFRTDFQYDPAHGGLSALLAPADTTGRRAVTRYNYGSFYPAPGVAIPPGVPSLYSYLKTSEDKCLSSTVTGATVDFTFVCPSADRVRTAYNITPSSGVAPAIPALESVTVDPGGLNLTTKYVWDKVGNKLSEDGPQSGTADTTTFAYDADRRPIQITAPTVAGVVPVTQFVYDDNGRQTQTKRLLNGGWVTDSVGYDVDGRKTSATGADDVTEYYTYFDDGRLKDTTRTVDGVARVTRNIYDAAGQMTQIRKGVGTALEQAYGTWTYNSTGQKLSEQDANGNLTTMCYDGFGRLLEHRFPSATAAPGAAPTCATIGAGGGLPAGVTRESYGYDASGNMTSLTRRGGTVPIAMSYDALGRMVLKDVPEADRDVSYGYDLLGQRTAASYPAANAALSVAWSYDKAGRVYQEGSDGRALTHGYAADASWSDLVWPDGYAARTVLDAQSRVASVQELSGPVLASYGYDALSRRVSVARGNGASSSYGWDAQQRLGSLSHAISGGSVTWGFGYNEASQIRTLSRSNDAYAWTGAYNVNRSYSVNALNQYATSGGLTLSYDARGNLTGDGLTSYDYDSDNRLTSASGAHSATLAYDALGRLARVTSGGSVTRFAYDDTRLVGEYDGAGALIRRHVHGGGVDEPVATIEGGARTWLYADWQGSIVATANGSGALGQINSYDPYGIPGVNNAGRFGYTGQANLPELGLQYYKARIYSPTLGRFLQTDPVGTADQINLYAYVANDPVNGRDPSGNESGCITLNTGCGMSNSGNGITLSGAIEATSWVLAGIEVIAGGGPEDPITDATAAATVRGGRALAAEVRAAERAEIKATSPYSRPSGATTPAQRASVQGKPCVKCGETTPVQRAGHKEPLVKEHYEKGSIDKNRMRSKDAVQPECPTCSNREGADMSRYSRAMRRRLDEQ